MSREDQKYSSSENSKKTIEEDEVLWSPFSDISAGSCGSSSSISWTDETEFSTAKELEEQFQKFEEALYLEASPSDLPQSLQDEVKIWAEYSPHIRIRGIQAKLNEQTKNEGEIDGGYDINYEEVIVFHESLESCDKNLCLTTDTNGGCSTPTELKAVGEDLKNALVSKLFDKAWPKVLEEIEPVIKSISAGKCKTCLNDSEKSQSNLGTVKSQRVLSRCNSSRSYLRVVSPRKSNIGYGTEYSCALSSRSVRLQNNNCSNGSLSGIESHRVPRTSLPKTRINRVSTFSAKLPESSNLSRSKPTSSINSRKSKIYSTDKTVILPPIETLAITPKKPDKRANSAMVRFTKTLPRVRPNTSKKKNVPAKSLKAGKKEYKEGNCGDKAIEESVLNINLEIIGTKTSTTNRGNRWR